MLDSASLIDLETRLGAHNYKPLDVVLTAGKGVWVTDIEGNRYLDCLAAYSAVFDDAVMFNARALMILMVAAFIPAPLLLFCGTHRGFGVHVVFALHLYVFVLALLCVSLTLAEAEFLLGGGGLRSPAVDLALTIFNLAVCAIYIYLALGPAYASGGAQRIAKAAVLALAIGAIFVAYRFAIFAITLLTT